MRLVYWTFCIALLVTLHTASALNITNTSGKVFKNARVKETRPDGIKVFHSRGLEIIPFNELSEALQQQYGYNQKQAKEFKQGKALAKSQANLVKLVKNTGRKASLRVVRVIAGGVLASGYYSEKSRARVSTGTTTQNSDEDLPARVFVIGSYSNMVYDQLFSPTLYPCGEHQYTSILGTNVMLTTNVAGDSISITNVAMTNLTVQRYAINVDTALQLSPEVQSQK